MAQPFPLNKTFLLLVKPLSLGKTFFLHKETLPFWQNLFYTSLNFSFLAKPLISLIV
jgi:hypothetical protein